MNQFYCSIISSVIEVFTTHPLDVLKTKRQIDNNFNVKTFYNLKLKEKYKGLQTRIFGIVPIRSIFLYSQDYFKKTINTNNMFLKDLLVITGSSLCQTVVDTPVEISKINKINNSNIPIFSYKGFVPHYLRNTIFMASVYQVRKLSTNNYDIAFYGAIGGLIGSYLSHPFDTLKTFRQSNINKKLTMQNAFKGANIRASMGFINMGISLFVYENLKKLF
jgi:hypothetical protein